MTTDVDIKNHVETTKLDTHELVRQLNSHLGPTLVATLAGVRDRKLPHKWAKADGPIPRDEALTRLIMAHRVWSKLAGAENDSIARTWFIGANPRLGEIAPVMKLREGALDDVWNAAVAFVTGTDD
ncbi:hypothetical protein PR370_18605 [Mycobacterium marinum]|uniref:hypothetical protein n=1 Tax=Mycobacterium marinum TaxID=1781 RepID=UPI002358C425|nr:hypothetical protein [Mycobacterium marinum]MDC8984356.1 hypothetical protein [Mycobacterium marinum]MDC9001453.1 hypothetical protein [Mycobacterium marinum]MDC9012043.1 hypothetical protein [Mycobacterium marinum]